jgi:group I intron endonuclease
MSHCIYFHRLPITQRVFYVGQSKSDKRPYSKDGRSLHWNNIVNKYGFEVEVVMSGLTKDQANIFEMYYILKFGRLDLGNGILCNATDGADGGSNKIFSLETRDRMSKSHQGNKNHMFGKTHSAEASNKISATHKGRKLSSDHILSIKAANIGRVKTDRELEKLRDSKTGVTRPEWVRNKLSVSRLAKYATPVVATNQCAIYEFESMKEAESILRRQRKSIRTAALRNTLCNGFRIFI